MSLASQISIERRFHRAIRLDSDLENEQALEGFICPSSYRNTLQTLLGNLRHNHQAAFTWTGPYGSGKSSLALVFCALLSQQRKIRRRAAALLGSDLAEEAWRSLRPGQHGWKIIPVVGRRASPVAVIGEALQQAGLLRRRSRPWEEDDILKAITQALQRHVPPFGGLLLIVDEMGKFLEAAAQEGADLYLFQQLSELASRSKCRFLFIGILHQAFEEYAHRLSQQQRDEWAKIQGRFVDLPLLTTREEQIEILSQAIIAQERPLLAKHLAAQTAQLISGYGDLSLLRIRLEHCWPLHPVVACLLGPLSRRRFGQNQRSIFGFLHSAEPHGFQDYLQQADPDDLFYTPDRLWDYLRANLEPAILSSPDSHRWALATEALERWESKGGNPDGSRLLKTIALLDLCKERSGLSASESLLKICYPKISPQVPDLLNRLQRASLILYKKYLDAYSIFAGSDFDIEEALRGTLAQRADIDCARLKELAGIQPLVAKRHFHTTGALRYFDVAIAPLHDITKHLVVDSPSNGMVGRFLLVIPTESESFKMADELCRQAVRALDDQCVLIGLSPESWNIESMARELLALEHIRNERSELAGDSVARREITARILHLQARLEIQIRRAINHASWYTPLDSTPLQLPYHRLNSLASELADQRFSQSPLIFNELINRQRPSSSAIAAQNALLRSMVLHEGHERLGIEGYPAERGLFESVLVKTGLYRYDGNSWKFQSPLEQSHDHARLRPIWEAAIAFIRERAHQVVPLQEIYNLWRQPPYGVKDGLLPILMVAFLLAERRYLAIYREGIFRAQFDDLDVEYLAKDPSSIQVRWMNLSETAQHILSSAADLVRKFSPHLSILHPEPIDVARALIGIFDRLPPWTKRTLRLSAHAIQIRNLFKYAKDPNKLLFDDLPKLGSEAIAQSPVQHDRTAAQALRVLQTGLEELVEAYPALLNRLKELLLTELDVPNSSPQALAELHERALHIRDLAGDFRLEAFISRLAQFDGSESHMEALVSLVLSKPPRDWVDVDLDRAALNLAELAQRFLRAELYARIKGRSEKRHALAVIVPQGQRPRPLLAEFELAESKRAHVQQLVQQLEAILDRDTQDHAVALAALAELCAKHAKGLSEHTSHIESQPNSLTPSS